MKQRKFILIKDYTTKDGVIKQGSDIILFRGLIYLNGGMVLPAYATSIKRLIDDETLNREYLREVEIIKNKI